MPSSLSLDQYVDAIETSGRRLERSASEAGLDAPVPTCPGWDGRALLAHVAMVHRWAAAHVRGDDDPSDVPDESDLRASVSDLPAYYLEGHAALLDAIRSAPADLEAMTFLKDAPAPREFWARRQAHETTIHMVDALGAALGRPPSADESDIGTPLAADGVDELLRGFFTRGRCKLFDGEGYAVAMAADDVGRRWLVNIGEKLTVDPDGAAEPAGEVAATVSGTAVELYLTLWNRGSEATVSGRERFLDDWRATQRVGWR
jgi:uncharacterized protein (TIGR03083 family)